MVVRQWVYVMVEGAEDRFQHRNEGRHQNSLFYAVDGMVASPEPQWLHGAVSTLVGLFNRVGLRTNARKTVGIVFHPCQAAGTQTEVAYGRRMKGEGSSYRECQKVRVQCKECEGEMVLELMVGHMRTQHGRVLEEIWSWEASTPGEEL